MRVLLTGGSGFIGSHVLPLLDKHDVLSISRNPARLSRVPGVRAIGADLKNELEWSDEVRRFQPEWCFHLAWEGLPDYSAERCRANLDASARLLRAVSQSSVRRVIVAGSCFEYGAVSGAIPEDNPPVEPSTFAATKRALLTVLERVARQSRFDYRWARIFFAYGPGQRKTSLIPHLRSACVDGRQVEIRHPGALHDFVYVEDVARALLLLAEADAPSGVFNIGTGRPVTVAHVANQVSGYYGRNPPFKSEPAGSGFWADTSKTFAATGWCPRIGIDEGIQKTLAELDGR